MYRADYSIEAMTHIRYVHRQLDVRQVMAALSSAKLDAVREGTRQCSQNKAMEDGRLVPSYSKCTQGTVPKKAKNAKNLTP